MFVISNTIKVKKGTGDQFISRFGRLSGVEQTPGFITVHLLQTRGTEEYDEFVIWSKWESKESHDEWTKTESFRQSHSGPRSNDIIDFKVSFYDVIGETPSRGMKIS
ncbi:antibiotic biosynthesis monooxygenase [Caldalkalibacillus mannanilyticus]|uniref:antibiotic biosynthesis monooxygenase n=1 Tax=Caldalkalibacillus mannanilyticus TaxID=1418 RepID=UPI00046923E5|nr:antibiotic biosynthesis monooxygenase [Caldalkalibacillus mannanilyticus]